MPIDKTFDYILPICKQVFDYRDNDISFPDYFTVVWYSNKTTGHYPLVSCRFCNRTIFSKHSIDKTSFFIKVICCGGKNKLALYAHHIIVPAVCIEI